MPLRALSADDSVIAALVAAIASEPDGVIVAGAMPASFAASRGVVFELAARSGYPIIAEAGSQLRFGPRPSGVTFVDHADLIPIAQRPAPKLVVQLGAEPVAASWPAWLASMRAQRWVLAGATWNDPDSSGRVVLGDELRTLTTLVERVPHRGSSPGAQLHLDDVLRRDSAQRIRASAWLETWRSVDHRARVAIDRALAQHPRNEAAVVRAAIDAVPSGGIVQIGNSLPIRIVDHVCSGGATRTILTQRGAAGIDGLISSAAGATRAGQPVLLVLGDVSFAHDLGGLLAARCASSPLAIVVVDNRGGQIFAGLPVARANLGAAFERHFTTAPDLDPAAVAIALGATALTAASPSAVGAAVTRALSMAGVTVIHAPVSASGAHDVRRTAIELYPSPPAMEVRSAGGTHE